MHDPSHVVFSIRRPPLKRPRRPTERKPIPAFAFWRLRSATFTNLEGETIRTPWRRRVMFSGAFFRLGRRWEWYLPSVLTVWHRDPEADGTDSSCRNAVRARRQAAIRGHRFIAAAWWDWWWKHHDVFHIHHWHLQFDAAQQLRRWALTRCETCGGRSTGRNPVNHNIDGWGSHEENRSFRDRWLRGEPGLHHRECSTLASLRREKTHLLSWLKSYRDDEWAMNHQRERQPFMGCYAWWREAFLGEPPEVAVVLAAAHVQRCVPACPHCEGRGNIPRPVETDLRPRPLKLVDCERCEGTGHERVEHPIPAELV